MNQRSLYKERPAAGPKRAMVTGGAGFIGSHLVDRLLDDGHEVVVVDSLATGRRENLAGVKDNPRLTVREMDVTDLAGAPDVMEGIEWVFHLAGLADIVPSINEPLRYHHSNVDGTVVVLEAARMAGVGRFVYAASSTCYAIPDRFPTPETAPMRPMYPYALTKHLGEQYVMHWSKLYGLPAVSLRLFNVYGPRSRASGTYGAVFGVFLAQKLANRPFTVVGDGTQTRDFTFVTDVVDSFVCAAASDIAGEVLNVGSGGTYSVNELTRLLGGEVTHIPKRPGEPDCTFADVSRIRRKLGWQARVTFEEGVGIMLQRIEQWRDAPLWDADSISMATEDWFKYLDGPSIEKQRVGNG